MTNLFSLDCKVCNQQKAKYKCPTCSIPYCSLACNKSHKASETCKKQIEVETKENIQTALEAKPLPNPLPLPETPISEADPTARDYVTSLSETSFRRIAENSDILQLLRSEGIQKCVLHIDSQEENNREKTLVETLLNNPEFSRLAEKTLQVVKE
ncbi:hypothetical protein HMI54_012384 [Coelomomyces lativittatus]|nr:hypothetical protein HMI56_005620 [Coelomomyces lativittatus]KAJ1511426.1 hypothetical protein HMI55_006602 [Coelomomyces lativittatus]KAJ1515403.1 hypothetical protein HMI54_012384 [Coelomomyces lativittatus]